MARIGKVAWYVLLTILVLTLPTYSYLVPRLSDRAEEVDLEKSVQMSLPGRGTRSIDLSTISDRAGALSSQESAVARDRPSESVQATRKSDGASAVGGFGSNPLEERSRVLLNETKPIAPKASRSSAPQRAAAVAEARAELGEIDLALEEAEDYLFALNEGGVDPGFSVNPFRLAMRGQQGAAGSREESSGEDSSMPDSNPPADNSNDSGDTPPPDTPSGNEGDPTDGDGSGGSTPEKPPEESPKFPFLYVGPVQSGASTNVETSLAAPADRGRIVKEDGEFVSLFNSLVSIPQPFVARKGEMAYTDDLNNDRVEDFTLYGVAGFVGFLEAYSRALPSGLSFVRAFFPFEAPISSAAHDFDSDGELEMGLIFEGSKNLFVYEFTEDQSLSYAREMVLPFYPNLLVSTRTRGPVQQQYLHVWDASLKRSIYFSSRYPGIYSFGSPSTRKKVQRITQPPQNEGLEEGEEVCRYLLLWYEDRLVIGGCDDEAFSLIGSFDLSRGIPTILVGNYFEENEEYLFVWP